MDYRQPAATPLVARIAHGKARFAFGALIISTESIKVDYVKYDLWFGSRATAATALQSAQLLLDLRMQVRWRSIEDPHDLSLSIR